MTWHFLAKLSITQTPPYFVLLSVELEAQKDDGDDTLAAPIQNQQQQQHPTTRTKRQALIPFPRTGKRSAAVGAGSRVGPSSSVHLPVSASVWQHYKRRSQWSPWPIDRLLVHKKAQHFSSLIPFPRTGKRSAPPSPPEEAKEEAWWRKLGGDYLYEQSDTTGGGSLLTQSRLHFWSPFCKRNFRLSLIKMVWCFWPQSQQHRAFIICCEAWHCPSDFENPFSCWCLESNVTAFIYWWRIDIE